MLPNGKKGLLNYAKLPPCASILKMADFWGSGQLGSDRRDRELSRWSSTNPLGRALNPLVIQRKIRADRKTSPWPDLKDVRETTRFDEYFP